MTELKSLSSEEIKSLEKQNCRAEQWNQVQVRGAFNPSRCQNVQFLGAVILGDLSGTITDDRGIDLPCGVYNAVLKDCEIGDCVRVSNIHSLIANYRIESNVIIENVGSLVTTGESSFGNGAVLETVNEGGGRDVTLYREITSQIAYLQAMHRYRRDLIEKLEALIAVRTKELTSSTGVVGPGVIVRGAGEIENVMIGEGARIVGANTLRNGTILSEKDCPTYVGSGVFADGFILAEGAKADSGAMLSNVYLGQAVKCGKQFSGENSLFFANSECFHSEACSVFGGPYTVSHHRSTLLIAAIYSFYNAGSGTNGSNHMYKLGPVHQGILERGAKTGSFSYMIWPCHISPFSVVIGKHMSNFDISEFPFSYVTAEEDGSLLTPAMNMVTVGTKRDTEKWPNRDKRKASVLRDQIVFATFSPYTVSRMLQGEAVLTKLYEVTDQSQDNVRYKGVNIKRRLLRTGARMYRDAIDSYLYEKLLARLDADEPLAADSEAVYSAEWADISGLLIARGRLQRIEEQIVTEANSIGTVEQLFREAANAYAKDEWAYVRATLERRLGKGLDNLDSASIQAIREKAEKLKTSTVKKILADAQKEFEATSMIGFGADAEEAMRDADFQSVRGCYEENSFVKKMHDSLPKELSES